jgi:hypothetical protein
MSIYILSNVKWYKKENKMTYQIDKDMKDVKT